MMRFGDAPYLECSSRGDKRFSAFYAKISSRGGAVIEAIYQASKVFEDGSTGLPWQEARGRMPMNADEVRELYSRLWDEYIAENPELADVLIAASGLSDIFGRYGHACQAEELWRIRGLLMGEVVEQ